MTELSPRPAIDLGRLAPNLSETCADYCTSYRHRLAAQVRRGDGGVEVAHQHARILDGLLGALFCAADAATRGAAASAEGSRVCLVAVGGYGRGLVGLASDVDVVFLTSGATERHVAALAEGLLYPLWDLGLEIGHAVRSVEDTLELAADDVRTATTLLDMRRVAGDLTLLEELATRARATVFEPTGVDAGLRSFLAQLERDRRERHERFGDSPYLLEPQVKLGCGGLRDLDLARWAKRARWGAADSEGAVLADELDSLDNAREFLWRVRNLLHLRAGRRQDRLTFADQEEIATQLGFVDGVTLGVEQFMQAYYRHAGVVEQAAERILARAGEIGSWRPVEPIAIGEGIARVGDAVTFVDPDRLEEDPLLAFRLYAALVRLGATASPYARDAIARAAREPDWGERLRANPQASRMFIDALCRTAPARVRHQSVLAELHHLGVMLAMIPEFEPVTGRVQHDVYHVYTVDVHSVAAVDRLRAIKRGAYVAKLPLASRLAAEIPRPAPLFLGLLLHDIGKAHGKDHSASGAKMARPIAERLGFAAHDVDHVVWLVEEHLSLYHWATRRDTTDPEAIAEVVSHVRTLDRLRDLYLLTVADLSTTNPSAMTSWKARMLEDLYVSVAASLEGSVETPPERRADAIRAEVVAGGDISHRDAVARFAAGMPDRYLLANSPEAIRAHAREVSARACGEPLHVAMREGPSEGIVELIVATDDRPGLLADVAAALAAHGLSIVAAQIYTRELDDGTAQAFDVFHVQRVGPSPEELEITEERLAKVRDDLRAVVVKERTAEDLMAERARAPQWARRHSPEVETEIQVDNDASVRFTVIDVFTRDSRRASAHDRAHPPRARADHRPVESEHRRRSRRRRVLCSRRLQGEGARARASRAPAGDPAPGDRRAR